MEFDLYWLLALPLFFALGWLASRHESRARAARATLPDAYFRGLNFLLNDQSDRAVDAFVDVVRIDPETVELHFALGKLFRRRGETDRAIRVHQNLLDRVDIDAALREQALFELAEDFLKAGLLDRADQAFVRLAAAGSFSGQALRHRIDIAAMMRNWPRAIELSGLIPEAERDESDRLRLTHFLCERAESELSIGDAAACDRAHAHLDQAERDRSIGPHPRIALLRGELAWTRSRPADAIAAWDRLSTMPSGHFNLIAARWLDAHRMLGQIDLAIEALRDQWTRRPSAELFLQSFRARIERDGEKPALSWALAVLDQAPSLAGLARVLSVTQTTGASDADSALLRLAGRMLDEQARLQSYHRCNKCGFRARQYYWHCPGCARWDSISPFRAEDRDS